MRTTTTYTHYKHTSGMHTTNLLLIAMAVFQAIIAVLMWKLVVAGSEENLRYEEPRTSSSSRGMNQFSDRRIWPAQKVHGLWNFAVDRADWRILKSQWIVDQL